MARGRKTTASLAAPAADEPRGKAPAPPPGLTAAALAKWERVVPLIAERVALSAADVDALAAYCDAAARRDRALRELDDDPDGLVVMTPNGARQINPLLTIADKCEATMMKLSERFGLDPASRQRLKVAASQPKGSAFAAFLAKKGATAEG
jgi:P27 family predicted phage terminase small subunit